MSELREWMQQTFGGLRDDRSDESYALEFLKTTKANLELAQKRCHLDICLTGLNDHLTWVKGLLERSELLAKEVAALEAKRDSTTP